MQSKETNQPNLIQRERDGCVNKQHVLKCPNANAVADQAEERSHLVPSAVRVRAKLTSPHRASWGSIACNAASSFLLRLWRSARAGQKVGLHEVVP
eukprot:scaffold8610_cov17-Tisochrysis_lutea.AAC.1